MRHTFSLTSMIFLLAACTLPGISASVTTPGPVSVTGTTPALAGSTAEMPRPTPTSAPLGTQENPLILALSPAATPDGTRVQAGKDFAAQLAEETGHTFVVVVPESYANLVEALGRGNAHIAVLSPYAYALAYEQGYATAAFAGLEEEQKAYGAQFIARADAGFTSYYDARAQENTADAATALSQFRDKKPCWADSVSPSGYTIPAGLLAHHGIPTRPAAFVQGQPTVARAVYVGGICDFGATYIDARAFPAVLDDFPDILEQVSVIFRVSGMQVGRQALEQAYGIEEWQPATDTEYVDFLLYLGASGVDLESLLATPP